MHMPQPLGISVAGVELCTGSISLFELHTKHLPAIDLYQSMFNCYVSIDGRYLENDQPKPLSLYLNDILISKGSNFID